MRLLIVTTLLFALSSAQTVCPAGTIGPYDVDKCYCQNSGELYTPDSPCGVDDSATTVAPDAPTTAAPGDATTATPDCSSNSDCVDGSFCNFDYTSSGFCETCASITPDCANVGLNTQEGVAACSEICEGSDDLSVNKIIASPTGNICVQVDLPQACQMIYTGLKSPAQGFADGDCVQTACAGDTSQITNQFAQIQAGCPGASVAAYCPVQSPTEAESTVEPTEAESTVEPTEEESTEAPTEPAVITQKLTTTISFEGIEDCNAALPSIKKACANVANLPESQVTVTPGAGCDASGRRQLTGAKEFNVEMEGSDDQIAAADTTFGSASIVASLDTEIAAIVADSGDVDHPMANAQTQSVAEPVQTAVTTTKAPADEDSGLSAGIIVVIVIVVLIVIGGAVFYMMTQNGGSDDNDVEMAGKSTFE